MGLWFMVCGLRKKSNHKPYGIVLRLFWKPQTTNHKLYGFVLRLFLETTNHKPYGFVVRLFLEINGPSEYVGMPCVT